MEAMAVRQPYRFTVEDYERMGRAGIFGEDDRIELIEGTVVPMSPIGIPHAGTVKALNRLFARLLGERAILSVQDPIILSDISEPQPDVVLLRPREDSYRKAHPRPEDVLLLVEVADTSGDFDRSVKAPLYARAGISEYWIVDLERNLIQVHRSPVDDGYTEVEEFASGARLAPAALPDAELEVSEILGTD